MGLDQYLEAVPTGADPKNEDVDNIEIAYWRKFNELQGYFERNYDQENCDYTKLDKEDIKEILLMLKNKTNRAEGLKPTEGFFYGTHAYSPRDIKYTKAVFKEALDMISDGYDIYYTCWY